MKRIVRIVSFSQILILLNMMLANQLFAQTGAAGVGNTASNSIWLDANELLLTNGSPVSTATDVSGNGITFTQSLAAKCPTFEQNVLNGLPAIKFDGVNDQLNTGAISSLNSSAVTYFIVYRKQALKNQTLISSGYASSAKKWLSYANYNNNILYNGHYSPTFNHVSYTDLNTFTFLSQHIAPTQTRIYNQGVLKMTKNVTYTAPTGHQLTRIGNMTGTTNDVYCLNGYIAEVIVYNTTLSNLQRILIENYLGAKYNMTIPTDFYAFQATHNIGLIALGNDGVNSQTTAEGSGVLQLSAPDDMTSNEYLLAAHTNVALDQFTTTDIPVSISENQRWTRTWKADETGEVGNVTIRFDLSGGNDYGVSTEYRLLVDNVTQNGDFSDATVLTGTYDGGSQSITFTTNIADGDMFTLSGRSKDIHSITSGNWSNTATWDCDCIPQSSNNVFIEPTHNVTVDVDAFSDSLSVLATATLTMNSSVTLNIAGIWDIDGALDFTGGTVAMVGDEAQSIDAANTAISLNNLTINNSTGANVTIQNSICTLNGTLDLDMGTFVISASPNEFIVNSVSDVDNARIGPIAPAASISGNVTVRRFIPGGVADYRDIASPVIGATLTQWDDDLAISGTGFPDGCAYGDGDCFYSAQKYQANAYIDVTSINEPLTSGTGFEVFMGDDLSTWSGGVLDVTGTVHSGADYMISLGNDYQLIGNPFASPISFDALTRVGVDNFYYVYCPTTGFYEYYDGSDGSSSIPELAGGVIAIGQGFMTYDSGSITFKESDKTTTATFVKSADVQPELKLVLKENSSTFYSSIVLLENAFASDNIDQNTDIRHLSTGLEQAPTVAMYSSSDLVRKNLIADDKRNKSFDLYTKILNEGYYTFEAASIENFNNYLHVFIFDSETGSFIDLKKEGAYTFHSPVFEGHRFTLILTNEEMKNESTIQSLTVNETETAAGITITQMGNSFNVVTDETLPEDSRITVVNVLGQTEVYSSQMRLVEGSNMITVPAELKGVHILVIATGDKLVTKKVVL